MGKSAPSEREWGRPSGPEGQRSNENGDARAKKVHGYALRFLCTCATGRTAPNIPPGALFPIRVISHLLMLIITHLPLAAMHHHSPSYAQVPMPRSTLSGPRRPTPAQHGEEQAQQLQECAEEVRAEGRTTEGRRTGGSAGWKTCAFSTWTLPIRRLQFDMFT
jgi:hypothetical protein